MSEYIIESAKPDDIESLVHFNCSIAKETEGMDLNPEVVRSGVRKLFQHSDYGFYLVSRYAPVGQHKFGLEIGKFPIVACLMVTKEWSDWRNGLFWWVQSVYVHKEHRGKRLFSAMYDKVKALARDQGEVCGFRLYVESENQRAQRVYENSGMIKTPYLIFEETL